MLVIEEDKEIKAYIIGTLVKNAYQDSVYLEDIFVKKDVRKRGFGKILINEIIKWSKSKKITRGVGRKSE